MAEVESGSVASTGVADTSQDRWIGEPDDSTGGAKSTGDGNGAARPATSSGGAIDPESGVRSGGTDSGTPPKRGRGRPPGSGNKPGSGKSASKATLSIEKLLFSVHQMGAMLMDAPDLELTRDEAKQVADAVADVSALYDMPIVNEKAAAWGNLALVVGMVYGTRAVSVVKKVGRNKAGKKGPEIIKPATPPPPSIFAPVIQGVK